MPIEQEMLPRDKYTIFDRKEKKYRKSIRSEQLLNRKEFVWKMLMALQSYQNGRECHNGSILLDTSYGLGSWCIILLVRKRQRVHERCYRMVYNINKIKFHYIKVLILSFRYLMSMQEDCFFLVYKCHPSSLYAVKRLSLLRNYLSTLAILLFFL